jgi:energy-coupling factor transporter ATP-binding protein EcfA2
MTEGAAVRCEDLRFAYDQGAPEILRGCSINIPRNSYTIIAGPSGAGKSTFARTLNNIVPLFYRGPFSGKRWIAGEPLEKQSIASMALRIGMVFQDFEHQLFSTDSRHELAFGLENFGIPHDEMKQRMDELSEKFGIRHLLNREPLSLSGGEKQKLAIASVMAYRPQILLLDEPTTDLDPESREFVLQAVPKLRDWVETIIVIDHESDQFAGTDRIFLLRDGIIQAEGKPDEILTNSSLLEENSIAPIETIKVQESLHQQTALLNNSQLAELFKGYKLEPIPVSERMKSPSVLEVSGVTFHYKDQDTPALQGVSLEIRQGEFAGIIGRNGSGKSTLLRHLNGLQLPQQGTITILGKDVREWKHQELARKVGLVFQNPDHQIFESTVRREIEFGPRQFGFNEQEIKEATDRAIEIMDLSGRVDHDPFQLSKGERQRVAVASILSVRPEILILDEPTTGLDYRQQKYLMDLLRELNQAGTTIVIVTHALKLVADYCNYAVLLSQGKIISEGHPRELFFSDHPIRLPNLLDLSRALNGNALNAEEFKQQLRKI